MQWTGLNELREKYLSFFESKEHLRLDSFPLVPNNDNSLLLINSGMAPLKKFFLGQETPPSYRVTTCQKCIRTPDIERVGITARHGTYFEMLGNFSFQNYFKREAITWAWEFFVDVLKIPKDKLHISVYLEDDEAYDMWTKEIGVLQSHMTRLGKSDNFWEHGTGPCGPCSEIHYDRGESFGCGKPDCKVGCDCDRFMEVWNLVFTQFDSDGQGNYTLLERPNIDTGMGLERLACVMQEVGNLFEVDTVKKIIEHVEKITGKRYKQDEQTDVSIRVITDHIRSTVFMVGDGVLPSNEGRGYVLRRLLRRAARHGRMLGVEKPFLQELCNTVINENKTAYPELVENKDFIMKNIAAEEERFMRTIDQGMNILYNLIDEVKNTDNKTLKGDDVFKLQDTFGFPFDLTKEIAMENSVTVDEEGFKKALKVQQDTARKDRQSKDISGWSADLFSDIDVDLTQFTGYETTTETSKILAMASGSEIIEEISVTGEDKRDVFLITRLTPFYAESGGQVADIGDITTESGATLKVLDCKKTSKGYFVHTCVLEKGSVKVKDKVFLNVDEKRRKAIMRNHTSAHLLQKALREVLGEHVHQAGSYVDESRVRFDFTHFNALSEMELCEIEDLVNEKIFEAMPVTMNEMTIKEAKEMGALALFGEKYGEIVRVVDINGFSTEFCGGTHVNNTSQLGSFKILSESSVAAGVRRIEGTTGFGVLKLLNEKNEVLNEVLANFKSANAKDAPQRVASLIAENKNLQKELESLKLKIANDKIDGLFESAVIVDDIRILTLFLSGTTTDAIRTLCDKIISKAQKAVVAIIGENEGKNTLCVSCSKHAQQKGVVAGKLAKEIAIIAGGNGGGKPDFAMAGIKDASKIDDSLNAVKDIVKNMMK